MSDEGYPKIQEANEVLEKDDAKNGAGNEKKQNGWSLLFIQSVVCLSIIIITLVLRLIGGKVYEDAKKLFNDAIMENSFVATIVEMFEKNDKKDANSNSDSEQTTTPNTNNTTTTEENTSETKSSDEETKSTEANATAPESTAPTVTNATLVDGETGNQLSKVERINQIFRKAPEGATFAPIYLNMEANLPLKNGTITSLFGYRSDPINAGESFHSGLDIAAAEGTPISNVFYGVVSKTGSGGSLGNFVRIYHGNGIETLYAHCSKVLVKEGAVIKKGETIALVGSTGRSTGNHVHIELYHNGTAHDPSFIVDKTYYD